MRQSVKAGVLAATVALCGLACGGSTPAAPTPSPAPTATATPTPAPAPTPTPAPSATPEEGEPPVTNSNPAARLKIRLYVIENPDGSYTSDPDPGAPIPNGSSARIDSTAKDEYGQETTGRNPVEFFVSDPSLVTVTGNHTNQRRIRAVRPHVSVDVWATQDGVRSNTVSLNFE